MSITTTNDLDKIEIRCEDSIFVYSSVFKYLNKWGINTQQNKRLITKRILKEVNIRLLALFKSGVSIKFRDKLTLVKKISKNKDFNSNVKYLSAVEVLKGDRLYSFFKFCLFKKYCHLYCILGTTIYKFEDFFRNLIKKIKVWYNQKKQNNNNLLRMLKYVRYLLYKIPYILINVFIFKVKILDDPQTIEKIITKKMSIARFGDGEFMWLLNIKPNSFQDNSVELSKKLQEVLICHSDNLLVCIPRGLKNVSQYNLNAKNFWVYFTVKYWKRLKDRIDFKMTYGNASITRPYIDYVNKKKAKDRFNNLKAIWDNRNVIIIEGINTKLGVGNDLFANTHSVKRILCPASNAFNKYNDIFQSALKTDKASLILIALGPTATILAYDLSKAGYQAIDIGHIDIEYEWYLRKVKKRSPIEGKAVNEVYNKEKEKVIIEDEKYYNSIIKTIL
jgi:glycosyltransferase family protein